MVYAWQITIPADGSTVALVDSNSDPLSAGDLRIANTGTVDCLLGGSDGTVVFPISKAFPAAGSLYSCGVDQGEEIYAKIATGTDAGELTLMKTG